MYVCVCNGVSDRDIKAAVANGCDSLRDLRDALNVATQCGKCARHARSVLRESRSSAAAADSPSLIDALGVAMWPQSA